MMGLGRGSGSGSAASNAVLVLLAVLCADPTFLPLWFDGHITASQAIGKPLVLEEFGVDASTNATNISETRDPVFRCAPSAGC